jgi:aminopeptidase N
MAHPVRPSSYLKIDNFYTATIYEKGAEVIRMLKMVIGDEAFRRGMDLYFDRWDGAATTMEAFIACFAEASGRDLSSFFGWYEQAGTPALTLSAVYDAQAGALDITVSQTTAPTPGQPEKRALPIPLAIGLLDGNGGAMRETEVFMLDAPTRTFRLAGVSSPPVISALRGFSAPVTLTAEAPARDAYIRLAADTDLFNRWEAGQTLARDLILSRAAGAPDEVGEERFAEAVGRALDDEHADHAFKALLLALPSESDLALARAPADPAALHQARGALRARMAIHLSERLTALHGDLQTTDEFSPDAAAAGRRALRNAALGLLVADPHTRNRDRAVGHFEAAANMTDAMGGLSALMALGGEEAETALAAFYDQWKAEPLVIDKWFAVQALDPGEGALGRVLGLTAHPAFDARNPNRLRSLVGAFASGNPARFHEPGGAGHRFLADQILAVDPFNPMTAARLIDPLGSWARYIPALAASMRTQLERIVASPGVSKNVLEQAGRALG